MQVSSRYVAPLAGAWIEILYSRRKIEPVVSLPSRERGLKYKFVQHAAVAFLVAPLAGAWIEISGTFLPCREPESLPSRERGLKSSFAVDLDTTARRSPRGSVD